MTGPVDGGAAQTLIYLHGFNSSPQSTKAQELIARVAGLPFAVRPMLHVPALPHRPAHAMTLVTKLIDRMGARNLTLIGSSLGGYYATWLAERYAGANVRAVVINPTTGPAADLRPYLGPQQNLYTGEPYVLGANHLREFLEMKIGRLMRPERYYLLVQTGDELLDYRLAVAHYAGGFQLVLGGGDHAFEYFGRHMDSILQFAGVSAGALAAGGLETAHSRA
ncbi:MAG: YqiA/YcfP family alpha/beta fold hydrolase [Betaproteobacteria bacterium]